MTAHRSKYSWLDTVTSRKDPEDKEKRHFSSPGGTYSQPSDIKHKAAGTPVSIGSLGRYQKYRVAQGHTKKEQCSAIYSQSPKLGQGSLERLGEFTDSHHDQKQACCLFPLGY